MECRDTDSHKTVTQPQETLDRVENIINVVNKVFAVHSLGYIEYMDGCRDCGVY